MIVNETFETYRIREKAKNIFKQIKMNKMSIIGKIKKIMPYLMLVKDLL